MSSQGLIAEPLKANGAFNWIYLTDWIVNGVLCLFFLFYFNRLFATVLLYAARLYIWGSLKVYIDIQALQISPLAGRIFFKGVRYHGDNETIFIHGGYITWRYWLRTVKECEIFQDTDDVADADDDYDDSSGAEKGSTNKKSAKNGNSNLPCRISIKVSGVEAFLYNRSPAYDAIIDGVAKVQANNREAHAKTEVAQASEKEGYGDTKLDERSSSSSSSPQIPDLPRTPSSETEAAATRHKRARPSNQSSDAGHAHDQHKTPSLPKFLCLLPIHVECNKAAAVLGSENTKSIITARVDSASGEFNASDAGPLDIFKILMSFHATHPYIQLKPNVDFKTSQAAEAVALKEEDPAQPETKSNTLRSFSHWVKFVMSMQWYKASPISLWPTSSTESIATRSRNPRKLGEGLPFIKPDTPRNRRWQGLLRYLDDGENDEHDEWGPVEYAKSSVLADINAIDFKFYWDIPGPVPDRPASTEKSSTRKRDYINGGTPPEYGMELVIHGGQVNYGPWADRNRIILQQIFFPSTFADSIPTEPLRPGESRLCTVFQLSLEIKEDVTLRIPFRESSKDAKWKGRAAAVTGQGRKRNERGGKRKGRSRKSSRSSKRKAAAPAVDVRPFAWFDLRVGSQSIIRYTMDMYPTHSGYRNKLKSDISGIDIFSSLNHGLLWHCQQVDMECDLSNPLAWNGLRAWVFNMNINRLDFFLLRDHTFLLVDLIEDWSSGPLSEFFTFAPYRYRLNVHFQDYKLYLNTNDANIVDNADSLDDNEFVILYGRTLDADLMIPLDRLRPAENAITFQVGSTQLGFELCMPPKNTLSQLLINKDVAQLASVVVTGSYTNCSEVRAGLAETLNLEIIGKSLKVDFYGFLARQLAKIKENYFGDSVHFRTLYEYQDLVRRNFEDADSEHPPTNSNDLDVILDITADDIDILLPSGLYDSEEHLRIRVDKADVDLRVNNYYLELMVNSTPLELSCTARRPSTEPTTLITSGTELFLDGIKVFGHRLFGLPPSEPPYASNWDIDAGVITGECSAAFVEKAVAAAQSFALTIADAENAVPLPHTTSLHDSTFVRFACPEIRIWCRSEQEAFLISTERISGSFNDLARNLFSQQLKMAIPKLTVACIDAEGLSRHRSYQSRIAKTHAYFQTTISLSMVQRAYGFKEETRLQREHIYLHDTKCGERAPFLVQGATLSSPPLTLENRRRQIFSLDLPHLPSPITSYEEALDALDKSDSLTGPAYYSHPSTSAGTDYAKDDGNPEETPKKYDRRGSSTMGLSPSAVAFSSPFKVPYFPLQNVELDLSDVPKPLAASMPAHQVAPGPSYDAQIHEFSTDEDTVHAAFIVSVTPGITVYCTPEAVRAIVTIMERIRPKYPTQILDDFHVKTINEVLASNYKKRGNKSLIDLSFKIPQLNLRFVNRFSLDSKMDDTIMSDRYNGNAHNLDLSLRLRTVPGGDDEINANSMHATLGSLQILAEEGSANSKIEHAAFRVAIDDILVWLVDSDRTSVHTTFHNAEVATASKKVEYLAKLIHRTTMLANEFQTQFVEILERHRQRLKYLVFNLTTMEEQTQDPSFLTRPSYVIRSYPDHIRNSDSWKILSRLRYNYIMLTAEQRIQLVEGCENNFLQLPHNAEMLVLSKWDSWRSWDAVLVKESFAVRILYGSVADVEKLHDRSKIPLGLTVYAFCLKVVIDPGAKQNEFSMDQLSMGLSIAPPPPPSAMQLFKDVDEVKSTVIQIKAAKYALRMKWNICELIDEILNLFEMSAPSNFQLERQAGDFKVNENLEAERFHIVLSAESGIIHLEAINLSQQMITFAPKVSVAGTGWNPLCKEKTVNIIVTADRTVLETQGHGRLLCLWKIISPSIWVDYRVSTNNDNQHENLKIAGDSKEIIFQVKDEIIGLIEIAHSLVSDEIVYIHRLAENHGQAKSISKHDPSSPSVENRLQVSLALFLNIYTIDLALLNDLSYSTSGRTIRLSISPNSANSAMYQVDYDLKAQTHEFINGGAQAQLGASMIEMPPINGTLQLVLSQSDVTVSGLLTIEKVVLDGAALYSVLSILPPDRVRSASEAIKADALSVQEEFNSIFSKVSAAKVRKQSRRKRILFDAGMVLDGIAISADAPSTTGEVQPANVLFDVQKVHLHAGNRSKAEGTYLSFPEIRFVMQDIGMELRRVEGDALRLSGKMGLNVRFDCTIDQQHPDNVVRRNFGLSVVGPEAEINAETGPLLIDVLVHLQDRMRGLNLSKEREYLRRLRRFDNRKETTKPQEVTSEGRTVAPNPDQPSIQSSFSFDLTSLRISYVVDNTLFIPVAQETEDLVLTLKNINLLASHQADARLKLEDLQLALVPHSQDWDQRPRNSALLPEVIFNVAHKSTKLDRRLVFQAAGKTLDLQLDPTFVLPVSDVERSITISSRRAREAAGKLKRAPSASGVDKKKKLFGTKNLSALSIDAAFAGAVVYLQVSPKAETRRRKLAGFRPQHGRYGQFSGDDSTTNATLRAPGVALKVRYEDNGKIDPSLNIEFKVDASSNVLYPAVVPLILQISDSVKKVVREPNSKQDPTAASDQRGQGLLDEESIVQADPAAVLGKTRLNLGLRICKQEFSLSCQPIAKVDATAKLEDIYITINNIESKETGHFFAASAAIRGLQASLKHLYSRDATFNFDIESIVLSLMNSKHISGTSGISAILKVNPTKTQINAKQLQDVLLFREIWLPPEIRGGSKTQASVPSDEPQDYFVQRYQQVAAAAAFPWNATVAIAELKLDIDLGQSIGKTDLRISNLWACSKKTTSSRQDLCVGVDEVGISSSGRMSGFVELEKVKVRTSIAWPEGEKGTHTPLIQGAVGFDQLRVKAAFDYQAFAVADISSFEFLMYNVRDAQERSRDRLVAILDGDKVSVYCIAASAAHGLSLAQAFERLVQEKQASYEESLKDIERFLRRRPSALIPRATPSGKSVDLDEDDTKDSNQIPISLHTDVIVTLRSLDVGAFPSTLLDRQVLRGESSDVQARFAVTLEDEKIHSGLGLTLGQLRVALANVTNPSMPQTLGEITIEEVVKNAVTAKGGVILRVPRVVATMQTWQVQDSNVIDYIFKSSFEGKIDVGWNYSRISFIRGMWSTHSRTFAARLGKPLPELAVRITGAPKAPSEDEAEPNDASIAARAQQKITAEVNLPQSKYVYRALEPPIIETPQLRDMGEATPPLEWAGLHRDRLPNVTHQIVIVTLLELSKEVEDAYSRILGSA